MQFKNTSDVTLQTDTNQHDTGGELHAKLRNDGHLPANHAPPAWRASEDRRRGRGAGGRRQGLAGQRVDAPSEARGADDSRAGRRPRAHQAARHHEQRRGRAAAHEHTKQPGTTSNAAGGPPPTSTPSSPAPRATPRAGSRPRAHQAARHHEQRRGRAAAHGHTKQPGTTTRSSTAQNTSGATHYRGIAKPPSPAGAGRLNQYQRIIEESRQYRDYRDRFPGVRSRYRASRRCPWRCLPSGDPRRRR